MIILLKCYIFRKMLVFTFLMFYAKANVTLHSKQNSIKLQISEWWKMMANKDQIKMFEKHSKHKIKIKDIT